MTWNLASMRGDMNADDPLGGLGPRVEPTPPPAPAPVSRGDGFLVHPDGTLSTEIEPPACPPPAPTPEPAPVAEPIPADAPPWPFPQGAMWRGMLTPAFFYRKHGAAAEISRNGRHWELINLSDEDFADANRFEPIASAPAPLKVGDKVRIKDGRNGHDFICDPDVFLKRYGPEGDKWERVA